MFNIVSQHPFEHGIIAFYLTYMIEFPKNEIKVQDQFDQKKKKRLENNISLNPERWGVPLITKEDMK